MKVTFERPDEKLLSLNRNSVEFSKIQVDDYFKAKGAFWQLKKNNEVRHIPLGILGNFEQDDIVDYLSEEKE